MSAALKQAAQLAQALRDLLSYAAENDPGQGDPERDDPRITAASEALAAFEAEPQQEPSAWQVWWGVGDMRPHWPPFKTENDAKDFASMIKSNTEVRPLYTATQQEPDKLDAERWRETLMRVGATRTEWVGGGHMFIVNLKPPSNVMQGSVAQHFTAAIDEARKAQP